MWALVRHSCNLELVIPRCAWRFMLSSLRLLATFGQSSGAEHLEWCVIRVYVGGYLHLIFFHTRCENNEIESFSFVGHVSATFRIHFLQIVWKQSIFLATKILMVLLR